MANGLSEQPMAIFFQRIGLSRKWLTFPVPCLAFAVFGGCAAHLFNMYRYGGDAIHYGGLATLGAGAARFFLEAAMILVVGMLAYVVFRAREHRLVRELTDPPTTKPGD